MKKNEKFEIMHKLQFWILQKQKALQDSKLKVLHNFELFILFAFYFNIFWPRSP